MTPRVPESVTASDEERALMQRLAVMVRAGEIRAASDRLATELQAKYDHGHYDGYGEGYRDGYAEGFGQGVYDGRREAEGRP